MTAVPKPPKRGRKLPKPIKRSRPPRKAIVKGIVRNVRPRACEPRAFGDYREQVKEADRLFSLVVRSEAGHRCRLCGGQPVQCAHLFSRTYKAVRWSAENAWALCGREHKYYTHHPIEWEVLLRRTLGDAGYEALRTRAQSRTKWYLPELILALASSLARIEKANAASGSAT